jgi:NCS1 family nucleobase:cation symporter-1
MIVDYFLIKRQHLDLVALYTPSSLYPAFNSAGLIAFAIPVLITLVALNMPALGWFYSYGWFTGAFTGALAYFILANMQSTSENQADALQS